MTLDERKWAERAVVALESIAGSLEKLANPMVEYEVVEELVHDATVQPYNGGWRAVCSCGWTSVWYGAPDNAAREAHLHVAGS